MEQPNTMSTTGGKHEIKRSHSHSEKDAMQEPSSDQTHGGSLRSMGATQQMRTKRKKLDQNRTPSGDEISCSRGNQSDFSSPSRYSENLSLLCSNKKSLVICADDRYRSLHCFIFKFIGMSSWELIHSCGYDRITFKRCDLMGYVFDVVRELRHRDKQKTVLLKWNLHKSVVDREVMSKWWRDKKSNQLDFTRVLQRGKEIFFM